MIALLRYAFLKSSRENLLSGLITGPLVALFVPVFGMAAGRVVAQMTGGMMPPRVSGASISSGLTGAAMVLAAISAATGGFWILRREVATREIGLFALATRFGTISLAATTYGALIASSVYLVSIGLVRIITGQFPPDIVAISIFTILTCIALSALGSALVALSPDANMMVPLYALTLGTLIFTDQAMKLYSAPLVVAAVLLLGTSAVLMRRRCAT